MKGGCVKVSVFVEKFGFYFAFFDLVFFFWGVLKDFVNLGYVVR